MRELMPQDLKFDLDRLTQEQAVAAARYVAGAVGKAHGGQMETKQGRSGSLRLEDSILRTSMPQLGLVERGSAHRGIMRKPTSNIAGVTVRRANSGGQRTMVQATVPYPTAYHSVAPIQFFAFRETQLHYSLGADCHC
jgi:hypothetical protein